MSPKLRVESEGYNCRDPSVTDIGGSFSNDEGEPRTRRVDLAG